MLIWDALRRCSEMFSIIKKIPTTRKFRKDNNVAVLTTY